MKITENTILAEILEKPELVKVLVKYNVPCLTCPMAKFELSPPSASRRSGLKLGQVCKMYGIDLDKLLKELQK